MKRSALLLLALVHLSSFVAALGQAQQPRQRPLRVETRSEAPSQEGPVRPPPPTSAGPSIRVALALDLSSAVITSAGEIVRLEETSQQQIRLAENQVRVEITTPTDGPNIYRVQVAALRDRQSADRFIKRLPQDFSADVTVKADPERDQQLVFLGQFKSEEEADGLMEQLKLAGYREARLVSDAATPTPQLAAFSVSNEQLLRSPTQLTFVALDSAQAPLQVNGKKYRGRIVTLLNSRRRITLVNELPLEEYLLSVVPNELGPKGFPELEALKAQAIAARTFAIWNRLNPVSTEYDVLSDTRSQVYSGMEDEHPLSTRAVDETRGMILAYNQQPIEALYTSTCGGKTENAEFVFNEPRPYLRSVLCAPETSWLASHEVTSKRKTPLPRFLTVMQLAGLISGHPDATFLSAPASAREIHQWVTAAAEQTGRGRQMRKPLTDSGDPARLGGLAELIVSVFYPEGYAAALLAPADADYILDFADVSDIPSEHRAAVAVLVRDGVIKPESDGRLNAQSPLTRQEVLEILWPVMQTARLLDLSTGTTRLLQNRQLVIQPESDKPKAYELDEELFLFKLVGQDAVPVRRALIIGGEKVRYHLSADGRIDYLEVEPNPSGVSRDRYSPFSRWETRLTLAELSNRLRSSGIDVGQLLDVRITKVGASHRVAALEVVGTKGTKDLRGLPIRSALGLRENLFVIDRKYDRQGRVVEFNFIGRGWGHGVGLCQVGAYGLALEGFTAEEILRTYYTGVEITRVY